MGNTTSSSSDEPSTTPVTVRIVRKAMSSANSSSTRKFRTIGNIKVSVINESFAQQKADVIVNCASADLDLSRGRGSKALAQTAGPDVQADLKNNYSTNISEGDVAVSVPGNLKCRKVYHVYLTKWNQDTQGLLKVITNCLLLADKFKVQSIVFPSLGTGYLGYPHSEVTKTALAAIEAFTQTHGSSSIDTIIFSVYDLPSYKVFFQEIRKYNPGSSSSGQQSAASATGNSTSTCVSVQIGSTVVDVVMGALPQQQVDVIVNSAPFDLDLSNGGLSEALLKVAGQGLQEECIEHYPNGISTGEILTTKGYDLPCSYVYHGCLPDWSKTDHTDAKENLYAFMMGCLEIATSYCVNSIAFPTLGSGSLRFPADVVADSMIKCVKEFTDDNPQTSLTEIRIVIYNQAARPGALQAAFKKACDPYMSSASVSPPTPHPRHQVEASSTAAGTTATPPPLPKKRGPPPKDTQAYFNYMYEQSPVSPSYWTKYDNSKPLKMWNLTVAPTTSSHAVYLPVDRSTFKSIENVVKKSWDAAHFGHGNDAQGLSQLGYSNIQVTKIERIENPVLFEKYAQNRAHFFRRAAGFGKPLTPVGQISAGSKRPLLTTQLCDANLRRDIYPEINEHYTFHGTPEDRVAVITAQGLDNRLAGNTVIGQGVYTAESSTKSDQYADCVGRRDKTKDKKMFLTRMCLGDPFILNKKPTSVFKRPPCKTCKKDICADLSHAGNFDSILVEDFWIFREFIVFEKDRCYPEYLITYKRV
ncbi:poly [ADP-ribose] polymerase 14-like isoform X2 [Mizuhopecten yessoensis]|uniref:poly [ADP-ribose] polymerase 14-like isoform X2 n=1 Tax=Mizuhopecten yessoensis TaxID=6573 RepID=UPI000B45EDE6|nr:poly [ADP-ribose] polymerase 14-like isoform X2 [Mizuhopecten yessoensis]